MSAAVAAALKKIAAYILSDKELRGKAFVIIGSIVCGFLGLLCLPVVVIVSLGNMEIEPPESRVTSTGQIVFHFPKRFFIRLDRKILCGIQYDFHGNYATKSPVGSPTRLSRTL